MLQEVFIFEEFAALGCMIHTMCNKFNVYRQFSWIQDKNLQMNEVLFGEHSYLLKSEEGSPSSSCPSCPSIPASPTGVPYFNISNTYLEPTRPNWSHKFAELIPGRPPALLGKGLPTLRRLCFHFQMCFKPRSFSDNFADFNGCKSFCKR